MAASRTKKPASLRKHRGARGVALGEEKAREMVLTGAGRVFARLGVRAATVQDVLTEAGISRRTFYLLYQSTEDVMVALYHHGTADLLRACRDAVDSHSDLLDQLDGCIDAHLSNARAHGRLMFVLGGEAQRYESALYTRRIQVHDEIVEMLLPAAEAYGRVDPLLLRTILLALESATRMALADGDEGRRVSKAALERVRAVIRRVATASLTGQGRRVSPLPVVPSPKVPSITDAR